MKQVYKKPAISGGIATGKKASRIGRKWRVDLESLNTKFGKMLIESFGTQTQGILVRQTDYRHFHSIRFSTPAHACPDSFVIPDFPVFDPPMLIWKIQRAAHPCSKTGSYQYTPLVVVGHQVRLQAVFERYRRLREDLIRNIQSPPDRIDAQGKYFPSLPIHNDRLCLEPFRQGTHFPESRGPIIVDDMARSA